MQLEYDPRGLGVISLFGDLRLDDLELLPIDDEMGEELDDGISTRGFLLFGQLSGGE